MEREALAALEKRVEATRVVTAEKAVLARSLASPEPMRFQNEIATAILALAVLVAFLGGRAIGITTATHEQCRGLRVGEYAWVSYTTDGYDVTLDTDGNVWRRNRKQDKRVPSAAVRGIADELARGCLQPADPRVALESVPGSTTISFASHDRFTYVTYPRGGPTPLCGSAEIGRIARAIRKLADEGQVD